MPKILVVDDNPSISMAVEHALKDENYQVLKAEDGKEGLVLALREKPDLIIIDIMMPVMSGEEMASRLKEDEATRDIPFIFLSTLRKKSEEKESGLEVGGRTILAKPFLPDTLRETIKIALKK